MVKRFGMSTTEVLTVTVITIAAGAGLIAMFNIDPSGKSGSGLSSEYEFDLKEYSEIEPGQIGYEACGEIIETGFGHSTGVCVGQDGFIYVSGGSGVRVFDSAGVLVKSIKSAQEISCIAVDKGSIYAGADGAVRIYNTDGGLEQRWEKFSAKSILTSIAVGEEDIFAADAGSRVVLRYDKNGELVNLIGQKDADRHVLGFVVPSAYFDILIGVDGLLKVVNPGRHLIESYTFNGDREFAWGRASVSLEGFCGCCNPVNIAELSDGSIMTCEKGLVRVKEYDSEGVFRTVVAGPEQLGGGFDIKVCASPSECREDALDVAVDSDGVVYVLDMKHNKLRRFKKKVVSDKIKQSDQ